MASSLPQVYNITGCPNEQNMSGLQISDIWHMGVYWNRETSQRSIGRRDIDPQKHVKSHWCGGFPIEIHTISCCLPNLTDLSSIPFAVSAFLGVVSFFMTWRAFAHLQLPINLALYMDQSSMTFHFGPWLGARDPHVSAAVAVGGTATGLYSTTGASRGDPCLAGSKETAVVFRVGPDRGPL